MSQQSLLGPMSRKSSHPSVIVEGQQGAVPTNHRTSVVSRVMHVLGSFSVDGPQLRAADIARRSGLPSATTHRVLQELLAHGAVERVSGGRYAIGPRLWEIGRLGAQLYRLWNSAQPHIAALGRATGGRAYLAVLAGDEGLRLDGTTGAASDATPCWVVERLPLHATAAGHVLLAFAGPDLLERVVRAPLTRYTERTMVSPKQLGRHLETVRRSAVAVSRSEHRPGEASVAAPVVGDRSVAATLEVVVRRPAEVRAVLPTVTRTAHLLSQELAAHRCRRRASSQSDHVVHAVESSEQRL